MSLMPDFFEVLQRLKPLLSSFNMFPPFMYLGPEPLEKKHRTLPAIYTVAHLVTCLSLAALSLSTGLLYISNGLGRARGQDQRSSLVLDHHIILNPDPQPAKTLWSLLIVLADVQPCDQRREYFIKQEYKT